MWQQSDICLSFSVLGVSLVLLLLICLCVTPHLIVSLGGRKKGKIKERGTKKKKNNNNKLPADFKPVQWVLLVFLDATGRGGLGFTFLPSYGFKRMVTKSGPQYSVSRPLAQVLHRLPGSNQPLSCAQHETSWAARFHRFHTRPLSLQEPAAEITLRARQLLLSSLQSSCPSFLKVPVVSHSTTFQPVWRLS